MRGTESEEGATRVAKNGYHYTKVGYKWRLTHHLIAEKALGRGVDTETERVVFIDKNRTNLDPSNVQVVPKGKTTIRRRIALIEARIIELEGQKYQLERELSDSE